MNDDQLNELLSTWEPPEPRPNLQRRIEACRPQPPSWWRRRIALPAPLLAAACALFLVFLAWSWRKPQPQSPARCPIRAAELWRELPL